MSSDLRSVLFMLFNPVKDELITGGVGGIKVCLTRRIVTVYSLYLGYWYFKVFSTLTLKVPIRTAAEDIYKYFFIVFQRK